jgi:hypothetical protein
MTAWIELVPAAELAETDATESAFLAAPADFASEARVGC